MLSIRDKVLISFASGILNHFKTININSEYELLPNAIKITLKVYNSKITTTVPYNVIINTCNNLEALQTMRFELIVELTHGIEIAGKNSNGKIIKYKRRRHKRSRK